MNKAIATDLSSAEVDLLNAKNAREQAETDYRQSLWNLNQVLGDPINRKYIARERIRNTRVQRSLEELLQKIESGSPALKDAKLAKKIAEINRKTAQKYMLPSPTISFSGISLGYSFPTANQTTQIRDTTQANTSGNFNVSAAINLTIPLTGDGGLFNSDGLRSSAISEEQAAISLENARRQTEISLRNLYAQVLQQEATIDNTEKIYEQANVVLESAIQSLQKNISFNRLDLKNAIEQSRVAEQNLTNALLQHFSLTQQIAQLLGIDTIEKEGP